MSAIGSVNRGVLTGVVGCLGARVLGLSCPFLNLVLPHLAGERVAVDAEGVGGLGEAAFALAEHAGDEALFELANGIVELHSAIDHLLDETFQLVANQASSLPVSRRKASTYFSRVFI